MKIYDISRPLEVGMAVYKNKPSKQFELRQDANFPEQAFQEHSIIQLNLHTGTHVDAPAHMLPGGASVDQLPLSAFFGPAQLLDLSEVEEVICREDLLKKDIQPGCRLLLKTKNSFEEGYNPRFVYLSAEGADYLKSLACPLVGIDAMSVERDQPKHPAHDILLGAGIYILEDIRLAQVPEGRYQLMALPLALRGVEASPVRAVLLDTKEDTTPPSI